MAVSASNTTTKQYPICTTTELPDYELSPEIHCDEAGLKLHLLRKFGYNEDIADRVVKQITKLLKKTSRLDDFWMKATNEGTSSEVIRAILQSIGHSQLIHMLKYQDEGGYTALHRCAVNKRSDVIQLILDCCVSEEECYQLLSSTDPWIVTPLNMSCSEGDGDAESVRVMLNHINQDMRYLLLQIGDTLSNTPLLYASLNGHSDVMNMIHESVAQTQWINLLQMEGYGELPVLQTAAYSDEQSSIETIRESVSDEVWLQLLYTPLPKFYESNHFGTQYQRAVGKIDELRTAARVKAALLFSDQSGKN